MDKTIFASVLKLLEKGIAIKEQIDELIKKEKDAKARAKLKAACDSGDLTAIRKLHFKRK